MKIIIYIPQIIIMVSVLLFLNKSYMYFTIGVVCLIAFFVVLAWDTICESYYRRTNDMCRLGNLYMKRGQYFNSCAYYYRMRKFYSTFTEDDLIWHCKHIALPFFKKAQECFTSANMPDKILDAYKRIYACLKYEKTNFTYIDETFNVPSEYQIECMTEIVKLQKLLSKHTDQYTLDRLLEARKKYSDYMDYRFRVFLYTGEFLK